MFGFIVRRLISAVLVVILTSMFVFALFFLGPSNPAQPLCDINGKCTPEKLALLDRADGSQRLRRPPVRHLGQGALRRTARSPSAPTYHCDAPCLGISYSTRSEVTES